MNGQVQPPLRSTQHWATPHGLWSYDCWGHHGRPVVFIPAVMFDRLMWWPAAADLRPHATVIAPDLPGHGASTRRTHYDPDEIVAELAGLVDHLGVRRAPVVVGHASAAALAERFAATYATQAVVTVDPVSTSADPLATAEPDDYLSAMQLDAIPPQYRELVRPAADTSLLAAYAPCRSAMELPPSTRAATCTRLVVRSRPPGKPLAPASTGNLHRQVIYEVTGRFPHLADVDRFVRDLRALL